MHTNSSKSGARILVAPLLCALVTLAAACGDKAGDEVTARKVAPEPGKVQAPAADVATPTGDVNANDVANAKDPAEERMATAVVTSKTAAPVDLRYDVLARPEVAVPFEIQLVFRPRAAADALEIEVTGVTGLVIENGSTMKFENVEAGGSYAGKVTVRADDAGLFYVGIAAKLVTAVQTDKRTFSVPVAVGAVAATQKVTPPKDSTGMPVQSMPATEPPPPNR
jgi:hypothetical protein